MTSEPYHIDPQADTVDVLKPVTAFAFGTANTNQSAAAFLALAADVAVPTLTNGELLIAAGSNLPAIVFGGLGGWSGFPTDPDRIYVAPLSTTAPTIYAHSMFNA